MNDTPATLTVDSAHYATLRDALLAVREDLSSVVSILSTEADNGAGFVAAAYTELRRRLVQGRLSQSEEIGQLIAVVLEVQEGGSDDRPHLT